MAQPRSIMPARARILHPPSWTMASGTSIAVLSWLVPCYKHRRRRRASTNLASKRTQGRIVMENPIPSQSYCRIGNLAVFHLMHTRRSGSALRVFSRHLVLKHL